MIYKIQIWILIIFGKKKLEFIYYKNKWLNKIQIWTITIYDTSEYRDWLTLGND